MSLITDNPIIAEHVKLITDTAPEYMKNLLEGQIEQILIAYNSAAIKALATLYYAIPGTDSWYTGDLREAMEQAKLLV